MDTPTLVAVRAHAAREFPRESCGVVIVWKGRERYMPCRNIAESHEHFVLHPEDYVAAEDQGEVVRIVHSHPNAAPLPSHADLVGCEKSGVPWLIVNWPTGATHEFAPSGYHAPLVGREFCHGILDCYTLIRDYYAEELGIDIPDFERPDNWWEKGLDLYRENFSAAGFAPVADLQPHDVIFMQVASPVPNHGAVYLGDDIVLQHVMGRLSSRDVYGGLWKKCTTGIVRHRSVLK